MAMFTLFINMMHSLCAASYHQHLNEANAALLSGDFEAIETIIRIRTRDGMTIELPCRTAMQHVPLGDSCFHLVNSAYENLVTAACSYVQALNFACPQMFLSSVPERDTSGTLVGKQELDTRQEIERSGNLNQVASAECQDKMIHHSSSLKKSQPCLKLNLLALEDAFSTACPRPGFAETKESCDPIDLNLVKSQDVLEHQQKTNEIGGSDLFEELGETFINEGHVVDADPMQATKKRFECQFSVGNSTSSIESWYTVDDELTSDEATEHSSVDEEVCEKKLIRPLYDHDKLPMTGLCTKQDGYETGAGTSCESSNAEINDGVERRRFSHVQEEKTETCALEKDVLTNGQKMIDPVEPMPFSKQQSLAKPDVDSLLVVQSMLEDKHTIVESPGNQKVQTPSLEDLLDAYDQKILNMECDCMLSNEKCVFHTKVCTLLRNMLNTEENMDYGNFVENEEKALSAMTISLKVLESDLAAIPDYEKMRNKMVEKRYLVLEELLTNKNIKIGLLDRATILSPEYCQAMKEFICVGQYLMVTLLSKDQIRMEDLSQFIKIIRFLDQFVKEMGDQVIYIEICLAEDRQNLTGHQFQRLLNAYCDISTYHKVNADQLKVMEMMCRAVHQIFKHIEQSNQAMLGKQ